LTTREFVDAWIEVAKNGGSQRDIAKKLGITPASVHSRSSYLRRLGAKLPYLNGVGSVDDLNEYIKKKQEE
jgi:predicted transcriptional regulator